VESWLIRDKFLTTSDRHAANRSMPTNPKKCEVEAIKKLIQVALRVQGVRPPLKESEHRHEFKTTHGLRKYFKTKTVAAGMNPLNAELLMDHKVGVENNYHRPDEQELLNDYLKAVDFLTINTERKAAVQLQKQVTALKEEREHNNYAIMGKLAEKEKEAVESKNKLRELEAQQEILMANTSAVFKHLMGIENKTNNPAASALSVSNTIELITWNKDEGSESLFRAGELARIKNQKRKQDRDKEAHTINITTTKP
jgi:hypothetical protein